MNVNCGNFRSFCTVFLFKLSEKKNPYFSKRYFDAIAVYSMTSWRKFWTLWSLSVFVPVKVKVHRGLWIRRMYRECQFPKIITFPMHCFIWRWQLSRTLKHNLILFSVRHRCYHKHNLILFSARLRPRSTWLWENTISITSREMNSWSR